jgi:hypothetical protein
MTGNAAERAHLLRRACGETNPNRQ